MRSINVWTYHRDFGTICSDARLDGGTGLRYPAGTKVGQAGWDVAIPFSKLSELATKLSSGVPMPASFCGNWFQDCDAIRTKEINRLVIMADGDHGQLAVNGKKAIPKLQASNIHLFRADLFKIGHYLRPSGATILLMGCLAGNGPKGTALLLALSRLWYGHTIVGFSTIGYRHGGQMYRSGKHCEHPGMRDTDAPDYIFANPPKFDKMWLDLVRMPWASEKSKHAKIARNGCIVNYPKDETGPVCSPEPPLSWSKVL